MTDHEMTSILDRAWKVLPLAPKALREGECDSLNWYAMDDTARRLIPLGSDCRNCGLTNLGLIAENLGRALLEISSQKSVPSAEHVTLILNALDELGELFVELEATSQLSRSELSATQIRLRTFLSSLRPNRDSSAGFPIAAEDQPTDPIEELRRCGDTLAVASESLSKRILADESSPYSASISGIHYLALRLRDGLHQLRNEDYRQFGSSEIVSRTEVIPLVDETRGDIVSEAEKPELTRQIKLPTEDQTEEENVGELATTSTVFESPEIGDRQLHSRVIVATESPFIRMLLQTAIRSLGVEVHSMSWSELLSESRELCGQTDILVCDRNDVSNVAAFLNSLKCDRSAATKPVLIGLCSDEAPAVSQSDPFDYALPRSNLTDLLNLIRSRLGIETTSIKMSA